MKERKENDRGTNDNNNKFVFITYRNCLLGICLGVINANIKTLYGNKETLQIIGLCSIRPSSS